MNFWQNFDIFFFADLFGIIAFAVSGAILAIKKNLDIIGIFIVSMLTAYGGGAIRDVLIGDIPKAISNPMAFYTVCTVVIIVITLKLYQHNNVERRIWFVTSDAIGLTAFSITGALTAIDHNLNFFGVLVITFISATGGGFIRDVLLQDVPYVLRRGFYGTIALIIASTLYALHYFYYLHSGYILCLALATFLLRVYAFHKNWNLPNFDASHVNEK